MEPTELNWFKSSYSGGNGGGCVEVALAPGHIYVRNTRNHTEGILDFTEAEWNAFLAGARDGEFDLGK
jgi:hypothetical protein